MSHVVTIETCITNLDALGLACEELGLELVRDQQQYKWYGRSVGDYPIPEGFTEKDLGKCEHAIRIPGNKDAYEIGVVPSRTEPGAYSLIWDFYAGGYGMTAKVGGNDGHLLRDAYLKRHTISHWTQKGYEVTETENELGEKVIKAYGG